MARQVAERNMSADTPSAPPRHRQATLRTVILALAADAILVIVFAIIGRATHHEHVFGVGGTGLFTTAWPFLAALGIAWIVGLAWRNPTAPVRTGIPVWVITVAGGMLLRAVSGQGTATAFVIVATLTLLLFLVGWRIIVAVVTRVRDRHPSRR